MPGASVSEVFPLEIRSSHLTNGKLYLDMVIIGDSPACHCPVLQWRLGSEVGSHTNTWYTDGAPMRGAMTRSTRSMYRWKKEVR